MYNHSTYRAYENAFSYAQYKDYKIELSILFNISFSEDLARIP